MRLLLTILCFIALQAHSQALFHAHNRVSTPASPVYLLPVTPAKAWYRSDTLMTLDGMNVHNWGDASGNGYDLAPPTESSEPSHGLDSLGGLPVISTNGLIEQVLTRANFLSGASAATAFVVVKINTYPPTDAQVTGHPIGATGIANSSHYSWLDGVIYDGFGTDTRKSVGTPVSSLTSWHTYEVVSAPSDWRAYINGSLQYSTTSNTVSFTSSNFSVLSGYGAGGYYMHGAVAEVVVYDRALSDSERGQVRTYLQTKYGHY